LEAAAERRSGGAVVGADHNRGRQLPRERVLEFRIKLEATAHQARRTTAVIVTHHSRPLQENS
jgi:hypothetical protein